MVTHALVSIKWRAANWDGLFSKRPGSLAAGPFTPAEWRQNEYFRDWAAKGTILLGVRGRARRAKSYLRERYVDILPVTVIHFSRVPSALRPVFRGSPLRRMGVCGRNTQP
jgi:hypothetical protein